MRYLKYAALVGILVLSMSAVASAQVASGNRSRSGWHSELGRLPCAPTATTRMLRTLARLTDIGALTTSRTEYSSVPAPGSMASMDAATMAAATMAVVGTMGAVIGVMADSMVTKGTVVESGEAINSTAEIASMAEAGTASRRRWQQLAWWRRGPRRRRRLPRRRRRTRRRTPVSAGSLPEVETAGSESCQPFFFVQAD